MKSQEVKQLSNEEINAEVDRLKRHLFDLRTQAVTEKLEDPSMLTKTRHDIARLKTEQRARQVAQAGAGQAGK